jgi:SAM-dependent methyltransferase
MKNNEKYRSADNEMLENIIVKIIFPKSKWDFLLQCKKRYNNRNQKLLDVGCGNNSVYKVKRFNPNCYYIGLDVGDYNVKSQYKSMMDRYIVTSPEKFADEIENLDKVDVIISSHNIEHCIEPDKVCENMFNKLNVWGVHLYVFSQ